MTGHIDMIRDMLEGDFSLNSLAVCSIHMYGPACSAPSKAAALVLSVPSFVFKLVGSVSAHAIPHSVGKSGVH